MIVVLDASAAAEIVAKSHAGIGFVNDLMRAERVLAPDLFVAEICNYMWKIGRKDGVMADVYTDVYVEMANDCIDYVDEFESAAELWKDALRMAKTQDHPVYDMLYAMIAGRHNATLLTMDEKLCAVCEKMSVRYRSYKTIE